MDPYNYWQDYEPYEETETQYPMHNYDNRRNDYSSKTSYSSKYTQNSNLTSYKNQNKERKEKPNIYNYIISNNQNQRKDNNYSYLSKNDEPRNSSKYYSDQNKYLTIFNSSAKRYVPTEANLSNEDVIRGYSDNCSFYVSGSSDLSAKALIKYNNKNKNRIENYNKNNNDYNRYNRDNRQKKTYESKTKIITNNDYKKKEIPKESTNSHNQKNENKNKKYTYNSKTNINTRIYTIDNFNENNYNNYGKNKHHSIYESINIIPKNDDKSKANYSRRGYLQTDPVNNIKHYNNRNENTENYKQPLIPTNDFSNRKPKATIGNVKNTSNNNKRIYKTSTNTNFEEKNKNNYYKKIVDKIHFKILKEIIPQI